MPGLGDMLQGLGNGAADVAVFSAINNYVSSRIDLFLYSTLSRFFGVVGVAALSIMTVWIMIQGFLIVTGRSQEGMKGFIFKAARAYVIMAIATGTAATSGGVVQVLTDDLTNSISEVMTGSTDASKCIMQNSNFLGCKVNRSFLVAQAAVTFVGGLDAANDPVTEAKKTQASYFAQFGAAGPAVVAGAMLLLFKFGMAMFVAFGPLFITCLMFKQTQAMFQKWLMYGIGLMFANAALAVVADISMDLVENVATAMFIPSLLGSSGGVMQASMQQLGLGLLLSTLIISVPPMAANFFGGMVGSFNQMSAFSSWGPGTGSSQRDPNLIAAEKRGEIPGAKTGSHQKDPVSSSPTAPIGTRASNPGSHQTSTDSVKSGGAGGLANNPAAQTYSPSAPSLPSAPPAPQPSSPSGGGGHSLGSQVSADAGAALGSTNTPQLPATSPGSSTATAASALPPQTTRPITASSTDVMKTNPRT